MNAVYIKGQNWWSYRAPQNCCWYWKKVCEIKNLLVQKGLYGKVQHMERYSVSAAYQHLRGDQMKQDWSTYIWVKMGCPKHNFVAWLIRLQKLKTRSRMQKIGVCSSDECLLCEGGSETHEHLFFQCQVSSQIISSVFQWCRFYSPARSFVQLHTVINRSNRSKFQRCVLHIVVNATAYQIWKTRNQKLWNCKDPSCERVIDSIKNVVKNRVKLVFPQKCSRQDRSWFEQL